MAQSHLDRLTAPKGWTLQRKKNKWTARPIPGPHGLNECITLNLVLKELLGAAKTTREVNTILNNGFVAVDKKVRKDYKFPVGLMDVVGVEETNEIYRVMLNGMGRFYLLQIGKNESSLKLLKIKNKRIVSKGRMQITFHDGRTMIADKFEGNIGDSVLFDLNKKAIVELLRLERGSLVFLSSGKHVGKICTVKEIIKTEDLQKAKVVFVEDGEEIITLMDYAFVVGKGKPVIKIESESAGRDNGGKDNKKETKSARKTEKNSSDEESSRERNE